MSKLVLFLAALVVGASAEIWPLPKANGLSNATRNVQPGRWKDAFFTYASGCTASPTLDNAFTRYLDLTFPHIVEFRQGTSDVMQVEVGGCPWGDAGVEQDHYPSIDTDESYEISIPGDDTAPLTLKASSIYGILRALESFSQLVTFDFNTKTYSVPVGVISDAPRFRHRGLMIDTARHFETLASIRGIIASLPYAKLNVLHWHMSDIQSFPMESTTHPKLWDAAYSEVEKYTQADIAAVVSFAQQRGVRVIVEFDMPGHAASWCVGYPEVCPSPSCTGILNVANNGTFDLIADLLGEMTGKQASTATVPSGLFPDSFIHLGGDEVDTGCWTKTPSVAAWLKAHNLTADDGYAYFVRRAAEIAMSYGRRPVQWSEVYDHFKTKLDKRTIVHIWKSVTNVTEVVANGYNVLLNVGYDATSWYLDNLNVNWTAVYSQDPCGGSPPDLCKLILGGHGEMWGETVDASDLEQTVWPRLAAIAEKLWSPEADTTDFHAALPRIEAFRCLLNRRGVKAAPVDNPDARTSPQGPGGCLTQ